MKLKYISLILLVMVMVACGKKGAPLPKESLNLPAPEWVTFTLQEEGVLISNPSANVVNVQKTVSEVGDLSVPFYRKLVNIPPNSTFIDNETEENVRYIYRLRTKHDRYDAYSAYISKTVEFKKKIIIEDVTTTVTNGILCLNISANKNVASYDIMLNGKKAELNEDSCYSLPPVENVLLVIVPYDVNGMPGSAYSRTLEQNVEQNFLPPQNIRVVRRGNTSVLSWNSSPLAKGYRVSVDNSSYTMDAAIFSYTHINDDTCTEFVLESIDSGGLSSARVSISSCK